LLLLLLFERQITGFSLIAPLEYFLSLRGARAQAAIISWVVTDLLAAFFLYVLYVCCYVRAYNIYSLQTFYLFLTLR